MDPNFIFEAPSDEEFEKESEVESESGLEGGERGLEEEDTTHQHAQSPWDFASYGESVAEEHARRSTTSLDFKIAKAREQRSLPVANCSDEESSESEAYKQVSYC